MATPIDNVPGERTLGGSVSHHGGERRFPWHRALPSIVIHLGCLGVIWTGFSWAGLVVAVMAYLVRMFVITAFYHRYFSHRTFQTSRLVQFCAAAIGTTCAQRGPLWWAAHHRGHHRESDRPQDLHSPGQHGFWWSHMGWFFSDEGIARPDRAIPDLLKYPELRMADRYHVAGPLGLAVFMFLLGVGLNRLGVATTGLQMLVWGFFISTVVLHHATFTINSLAHVIGSRRYDTHDDSRNNLFLALLTLGEGWHNNHHFNPGSVRQGFFWWEIDVAYYCLSALSKVGIVWDLRPVPRRAYSEVGAAGDAVGEGEARR